MKFYPLESNPDLINVYLRKIGLKSNYGVADVYGFTDDLLEFVVRPVYAVIFLYPVDGSIEGEKIDEDFSLLDESEEERNRLDAELSEGLYYMKQTIGNACGTIALIHAIANNLDNLEFESDSILKRFIDETVDKTPLDKCLALEQNEEVAVAHEDCATAGETQMDENTPLHYVALVEHNGYIWQCDGRKTKKPIRVAALASKDAFLEAAAEYALKFMQKNPNVNSFSALTLNKLE